MVSGFIGITAPRAPGYVGPDRRGLTTRNAESVHVVRLTVVLAALVWIAMLALDVLTGAGDVTVPRVARTISALAAAFAIVTGVLALARWRLVSDAAACIAGVAMAALGVFTVGVPDVIVPLLEPGPGATRLLASAPAGVVAAMGCLLAALRLPAVDTRVNLARAGAGAAVTFITALGLFTAVPALASSLTSTSDRRGHAIVALGWAALAFAFARDARTKDREISIWLFALLFCLAQSRLARVLAVSFGATWQTGGRLFTLLGFLVAYAGAVRIAQETARRQQLRLLESIVEAQTATADRDAERAARADLDHDLRSALMAIDGAATTLERYLDRLNDCDRTALVRSLSSEIGRIQALVTNSHQPVGPFAIGSVTERVALCDGARGWQIAIDVPADLKAVGSPDRTAEILRNLVDNAFTHAGGNDVSIRAERGDDQVLVFVEDRGPGLPVDAVDRLFERGWSSRPASSAAPRGLGLHLARRLAHEQNGRLWAQQRPGGGAAFVLALPVAGLEER